MRVEHFNNFKFVIFVYVCKYISVLCYFCFINIIHIIDTDFLLKSTLMRSNNKNKNLMSYLKEHNLLFIVWTLNTIYNFTILTYL